MITILNGKLTIPESERFIGFAGDNLARTIEFLISGRTEADRIYRLYLTFDDGTVNHFVLPYAVKEDGVLLTWQVKREHLFKSGNVRVQIKAFSGTGIVYHTKPDTFIVGNSAEFTDNLSVSNSEFLEYEQMLNNLKSEISEISVMTPYIGENGNWYVFDAEKGEYKDSGRAACSEGQNITVDQVYDSTSANAQSGKAVAQAVADFDIPKVDQYYSSESSNAQSGKAVAQAVAAFDIPKVDQYYSSESSNAQSGKAVAQALAQFDSSGGNCWQRKRVDATTCVHLDTIIRTVSSDCDMFVLTLGPDLLVDGMYNLSKASPNESDKPFIAYIDGKGNGSIFMMDMGNGSWWKFKSGDSYITRIEPYVNKDFEYLGYFISVELLAEKVTSGKKLYIAGFDGQTIDGVYLPEVDYFVLLSGNTVKLIPFVFNGKSYNYNKVSRKLTENSCAVNYDFIFAGNFHSVNKLKSYTFMPDKTYSMVIDGEASYTTGISNGTYFGRYFVSGTEDTPFLEFVPFVPNGKKYTLNLNTYTCEESACSDIAIKDQGEYFVSQTVEGALQELGAELSGVANLLAQI